MSKTSEVFRQWHTGEENIYDLVSRYIPKLYSGLINEAAFLYYKDF